MHSSATGTVFIRFFVLFLGLIVALSALNKLYTYFTYRYLGGMTYGIIDHPSSSRDFGGRPLIQYEDAAGKVHEFKSKAKTHWFRTPRKGEKIKIYFDRKEPQNAIADNLFYYFFLPLGFLAVGGYCCFYVFFYHKKSVGYVCQKSH